MTEQEKINESKNLEIDVARMMIWPIPHVPILPKEEEENVTPSKKSEK